MNRQPSRSVVRRAAARAFQRRNRLAFVDQVRQPEPGETPLSDAEVDFAVAAGLLAPVPFRKMERAGA